MHDVVTEGKVGLVISYDTNVEGRGQQAGMKLTLPSDEATNVCDTVENVPKIAIAKSMICLTIVCAASATAPRAAQQPHLAQLTPYLHTQCCTAIHGCQSL